MLREIINVRQIDNESRRRWFEDEFIDLIVWLDTSGDLTGFQLCYDKCHDEHALTWKRHSGFSHLRVDDGEYCSNRYKGAPILLPDGVIDATRIQDAFRQRSAAIERQIAAFVSQKLSLLDCAGHSLTSLHDH